MKDAWSARLAVARHDKVELQKQLADVNRQIESLLDKIVEANSATVVSAYEARIDKLERKKIGLGERLEKTMPQRGQLEECIELALTFLSSPWKIYESGANAMRQTVLRLAFAEPLRYAPNGVYGTPEFSFPFKYLREISGQKSEMVHPGLIELRSTSKRQQASPRHRRKAPNQYVLRFHSYPPLRRSDMRYSKRSAGCWLTLT